jgi:hypothetical protein
MEEEKNFETNLKIKNFWMWYIGKLFFTGLLLLIVCVQRLVEVSDVEMLRKLHDQLLAILGREIIFLWNPQLVFYILILLKQD